ncbi:vitamin B12 transporter BtuB [mine drainage metagenome]|uniref:Vitamin B12 transporter BtuB n=1 Tax=mine drainage metagenome TaxID=410659 RepID=A0A1J5Q8Y6_9ZZZZ
MSAGAGAALAVRVAAAAPVRGQEQAAHRPGDLVAVRRIAVVQRGERIVQEFLRQVARQHVEDLVGCFTAREHAPRALDLGALPFAAAFLQLQDQRHLLAVVHPAQEALHAGFDDRFGLLDRGQPLLAVVAYQFGEVVDRVQVDVGEVADFGFDVAWHRQVDHHHRLAPALADHPFGGAQADDRQRARRRADDDVELGQPLGASNFLKVGLFYKQDVHRETDLPDDAKIYPSPWLRFEAHTWALGAEDTFRLSETDTLTFGYRRDRHRFDQAQQYADKAETQVGAMPTSGAIGANNAQVVWRHELAAHTELRAGIGQKTRFPSIKETYSYRLGQAIPNPALGPEQSLNREVGISGVAFGGMRYDASVYWDSIKDAIESVAIGGGISQAQNVGTATNKGLDLSVRAPVGTVWIVSAAYSYLDRTLGTQGLVATGTPRNWADIGISWLPGDATEVAAHVQAAGSRQTTTDGKQPVAGYAVVNLRWAQRLAPRLTLYANLDNAFDRNYQLSEGFPMPGRELRLQLQYKL